MPELPASILPLPPAQRPDTNHVIGSCVTGVHSMRRIAMGSKVTFVHFFPIHDRYSVHECWADDVNIFDVTNKDGVIVVELHPAIVDAALDCDELIAALSEARRRAALDRPYEIDKVL